uniref:Vesicle transport through interaction with t-SNAREs homolog 1B n=1 Tax=Ciona intestinalis TaxID=7719 RepID=F7BGS1_CIOIN|nr:vesicle transport through interaction with t-SNAREs homolog 1B isoform X1 [Ciona intestinalis]|eukprot:XP_002130133.1 vesicle transport through interaction with t-SNAREs homolog 1B isoform X1 [Ciona intestinalis]
MSRELYEDTKESLRSLLIDLKQLGKQSDFRNAVGEERQIVEKEVNRKCTRAQILVKDLENEVYQAPTNSQASMNREIKTLKFELESVILNLQKPSYMRQASYGRGSSSQFPSNNHHQDNEQSLMLLGQQSMQRASDSITRSNIISAESEVIGNEVLGNLDQQREQLHRTRDRLQGTDDELSQTKRILRSISRNIISNRILLIFIIALELGSIGFLVYRDFFQKQS